MNRVTLSPEYFPNPTIGRPISNADIYVGIVDLDPVIVGNQKQISVQQENGTIVQVSQPISTGAGGVPLYNGSPVTVLVDGNYSLKVLDKLGAQIYYVPSQADFELEASISVTNMLGLIDVVAPLNNDTAYMFGFFFTSPESNPKGGGNFIWQSNVDKATANGGTIIDPDNTGGYDGSISTLAAFLSAQGGGVGLGCWVREDSSIINPLWFGTGNAAVAAAAAAGVANELPTFYQPGDTNITSLTDYSSGSLSLEGTGDDSNIICTGVGARIHYEYVPGGWNDHSNKSVRKLRITGDKTNTGIEFITATKVNVEDVSIDECLVGLILENSYSNVLKNLHVNGDILTPQTTGVLIKTATNTTFINPYFRDHLYGMRFIVGSDGFPNENIQILGGAFEGNESGTAIKIDSGQTLYQIHLFLDGVYFERNGSATVKSIDIPSQGDNVLQPTPYDVVRITAKNCKFSYTADFGGTGEYDWGDSVSFESCSINGFHTAVSKIQASNCNFFAATVISARTVDLESSLLSSFASFRAANNEPCMLSGFRDSEYSETAIGHLFQAKMGYTGASAITATNFIAAVYPYYASVGVASSEVTPIDFGAGSWQQAIFAASIGSTAANYVQSATSTEGSFRVNVFLMKPNTNCQMTIATTGAALIGSQTIDMTANKYYKIVVMNRKTGADGAGYFNRIFPADATGPTVTFKPLYDVGFNTQELASEFIDGVAAGVF